MSIEIIQAYYKDKINPENPDYKIHGWEDEDSHLRRFNVLYKELKLSGKSILDVGCGAGPLYRYFKERKIANSYLGVDILPEMIALAKKRYPETVFLHQNIFEDNPFPEKCFDVVYASGIFNLDLGNNELFVQDSIALFGELASQTVVFNLLSTKSQDKESGYYYAVPENMMYLIKKSGIKYIDYRIIEDYLHNDFTVIIELE